MVEKNRKRELNKMKRVYFDMNTGTRTHKSKKHPHRRDERMALKKALDKCDYQCQYIVKGGRQMVATVCIVVLVVSELLKEDLGL